RIVSMPNRTGVPTGASNCETRAVILSSPCSNAIGSEIVSADAAPGSATARAAKQRAFRCRAGNFPANAREAVRIIAENLAHSATYEPDAAARQGNRQRNWLVLSGTG